MTNEGSVTICQNQCQGRADREVHGEAHKARERQIRAAAEC